MTDSEYAVKLRSETHIDEVAEVSKRGAATVPDYSGHSFAEDGFNYRTAYFKDSTGYYKLTLSVGKNGSINTIYNVGKIEEAKFPRRFVAQRPEKNLASIDNVSQPDTTVNTSIREKAQADTTLLFSTKDTNTVERLTKENEKLKQALELMKQEFKLTKGHHVSDTALNTLAGKMLKQTHSKADKQAVVAGLRKLYDYIGCLRLITYIIALALLEAALIFVGFSWENFALNFVNAVLVYLAATGEYHTVVKELTKQ